MTQITLIGLARKFPEVEAVKKTLTKINAKLETHSIYRKGLILKETKLKADLESIVKVCLFYSDKIEALKLFEVYLDEIFDNKDKSQFQTFHKLEKATYQKRITTGIPRETKLLKYHLESLFESEHSIQGNPSGNAFIASEIKYHGDSISNSHKYDY